MVGAAGADFGVQRIEAAGGDSYENLIPIERGDRTLRLLERAAGLFHEPYFVCHSIPQRVFAKKSRMAAAMTSP